MDKLETLKALLGITTDEEDNLLNALLSIAENKVLNKLFPFGDGALTVPSKYDYVVVQIAQYIYLKQGAEGETAHSENGISRTYGEADIPNSLLKNVVPFGAVFKYESVEEE